MFINKESINKGWSNQLTDHFISIKMATIQNQKLFTYFPVVCIFFVNNIFYYDK